MRVITWALIAFTHIHYTAGVPLEKPIALRVLKQDLEFLSNQFPTADLWPSSKVIKYDKTIFVVDYDHQSAGKAGGKNFLMVVGDISLATIEHSSNEVGHKITSTLEIRKIFVDSSWVYFDDRVSEPVLKFDDYYIVDYHPPSDQFHQSPIVEYISKDEFEKDLNNCIPRIRYESDLSGADVIKTYVRTKNDVKLNTRYNRLFDLAVIEGDFHFLVMTNKQDLIEKNIHLDKLSYHLAKQEAPDLVKLDIYGVRVTSFPTVRMKRPSESLKLKTDIFLKDVLDNRPPRSTPEAVGVIKYGSKKILTVSYIQRNQRVQLGVYGKFMTSDGIGLDWLCFAFPEGQLNKESAYWLKSRSQIHKKPVIFSCFESGKDSQILLQDDEDYIEIVSETKTTTDIISKLSSVEPYLEYISQWQFGRTLDLLSDVMSIKCSKENERESYKLFVNVFVIYDCRTGMIYFEAVDLLFGPQLGRPFLSENLGGVSYDSNIKSFERKGELITNFKVRQLHPSFPHKIPTKIRYMSYSGTNDVAFDLKSFEGDLYDIRENLLKNLLPQWGVVRVDSDVLFVAEKSQENIHGVTKSTINVKCKVAKFDPCTKRECMETDQVIYDGTTMSMRNNHGLASNMLPARVYWPQSYKLPKLNDLFSVSYQIRYIKLQTFQKHMKALPGKLWRLCVQLGKEQSRMKITLYIYYSTSKEPIIGYFECAFNYIFFMSDFKIIKLTNIHEIYTPTSHQDGDEGKAKLGISEISSSSSRTIFDYNKDGEPKSFIEAKAKDQDLRSKDLHSEYVVKNLLYDPIQDTLHSKSMFLTDVYALRLLPKNFETTSKRNKVGTVHLKDGPKVDVYIQYI